MAFGGGVVTSKFSHGGWVKWLVTKQMGIIWGEYVCVCVVKKWFWFALMMNFFLGNWTNWIKQLSFLWFVLLGWGVG